MDGMMEGYCIANNLEYRLNVLSDIGAAEYVVRTVTGQEDLCVQKTAINYDILDVYAIDAKGLKYDIDIRWRGSEGNKKDILMYNPSFSETMGEPMKQLSIMFIPRNMDGHSCVMYSVDRETKQSIPILQNFPDTYYVNYMCAFLPSPLGNLIYDFKCRDPKDMYSDILRRIAEQVLAGM